MQNIFLALHILICVVLLILVLIHRAVTPPRPLTEINTINEFVQFSHGAVSQTARELSAVAGNEIGRHTGAVAARLGL